MQKNGEIEMIIRKDLEKHLEEQCVNRDYRCEDCGKKDTYANIRDVHDNVCEKKTLHCPNPECTATMERGKLKKHLEKCEYTAISCRYNHLGCNMKLKRGDMEAHEQDDKAHLHQALDTVATLEMRLASLEDKCSKFVLQRGEMFTFKLTNYQERKRNKEVFRSPPFYTSPGGYKMHIKVYPNGKGIGENTHISIYVTIVKGDYDNNLKWPFIGSIKLELLNQLEDRDHYHSEVCLTEDKNLCAGSTRGFPRFSTHSGVCRTGIQYLRDDTLFFRASVLTDKPWLECSAQ